MKARKQTPIRKTIEELAGADALSQFNQFEAAQTSRDLLNRVLGRAALQGYAYNFEERQALVALLEGNRNAGTLPRDKLLQITSGDKAEAFESALSTEMRLRDIGGAFMARDRQKSK